MYHKDSPQTIQSMFNQIAKNYDRTNFILSLSLHNKWNRTLVGLLPKKSQNVLIDLCSGTGEIAFHYLKMATSRNHAYLIDFSSEMLHYAKLKETQISFKYPHELSYIEANVQNLPLPDQFADCATMAYGIRNVQDPSTCIRDVYRVLKSGGCFAILELTRPHFYLFRLAHHLYLRTFIPLMGKWLTENREAYQYLCQSIQNFIAPSELAHLLKLNGFNHIQTHSLSGGIATIVLGYKQ